ncbi:hypothetical protein [Nonomuraea sp. B19D2]|uniref:hypothetical protein n=1 Tax=Nonomuraea sp. B19D2 TaxID=3159561 RepID=UPI0032DB37D5
MRVALAAKGLVARARQPEDRRSVLIDPTEAGLALLPSIFPIFGGVGGRLLAGFSADEQGAWPGE